MELLEQIKNNLLLILVIIFFLLMALRGFKRGLLHMASSFGGLAVSVFAAKALMPKLAERLLQNQSWVNFVETTILPKLPMVSLEKILYGIAFLILFIAAVIIVSLLVSMLGKLTEGPVIGLINKLLGAALGLLEALVYTWAFMLFVELMPQLSFCEVAAVQIAADPLLCALHDNNLLTGLLQTVLK